MPPDHTIRCSSIPTFSDCPRRWLATQRRRLLSSAGYRLLPRHSSIAAHIGSGVHAGAQRSWEGVTEPGAPWTSAKDAIEVAIETMRQRRTEAEAEGETIWDAISPTPNDAERSTTVLTHAYRDHTARDRVPSLLEGEVGGELKSGWALSGHVDIFDEGGVGTLEDLKTGKMPPTSVGQLGAYRWAIRAQKHEVGRVAIRWLRRGSLEKPPDPPAVISIDPALAEAVARRTVGAIRQAQESFEKSGDLLSFPANPACMMCSAKYCPAFHSQACPESRIRRGDDDDGVS